MNSATLKVILVSLFCLFVGVASAFGYQKNADALRDGVKKSVVSIRVQIIKVPYSMNNMDRPLGTGQGTGFVIDNERGLILTNKHISDTSRIQHLEVTFFNGKEIQAELMYSDPWQDFAILAVKKKDMPSEVQALKLSGKQTKVGQAVLMIGNNQSQALSVQTGTVSSIYQSAGFFPNQSLRISLNSRGGSSGSPVCDQNGEVVAIQCGGDQTFAHALPVRYVSDALIALNKGEIPARRDTGAMLGYYSLDRAVRFFNFPKAELDSYAKDFPGSRNTALIVEDIFRDAPAHGILKIGDIIWTVNGIKIGPELYQMQAALNTAKDKANIEVYRDGVLKSLEVPTYDLESVRVKEMVSFGGAMFFKADDLARMLAGAELGDVLIGYTQPGASFRDHIPAVALTSSGNEASLIKILRINGRLIDGLESLSALIPGLVAGKDLVLEYQNYLFSWVYNGSVSTNRRTNFADVRYSGYDDAPTYFKYDSQLRRWNSSPIIE